MSDEQDKLRASLEAPKLFGRKKKPAAVDPAPVDDAPAQEPAEQETQQLTEQAAQDAEQPETAPVATVPPTPVPDPVPAPAPTPAPQPEPVPAPEPSPVPDPAPAPLPEPEPAPEPAPEPTPGPEPTPEPAPIPEPAPAPATPLSATMAGPVEPVPVVTPAAKAEVRPPTPRAAAEEHVVPLPAKASQKAPAPKSGGGRAVQALGSLMAALKKPVESPDETAEPLLSPYRAATLTGLVVGAVMVLLTWLSLRGCEAVRGTSSCGGGPGFLLLILIFALSVYLGSALLKAFVISDPGSTSFLAVGLVAVVALLVLIRWFDHWIMIIVIPLVAIASYLGSVWITKTFVEPDDG